MSIKSSKMLLLCLMLLVSASIVAEVSLERQGNEAAAEADDLFEENRFAEAGRKYEEALNFFIRVEEEDGIPMDIKIEQMLENMVASFFSAQDYESTIRAVKMRLQRDPANDVFARTIAQIYERNLNNPRKAIEVLEDFNENAKNRVVKRRIGDLYSSINDYENALVWYRKAFEIRADADLLRNIAVLYNRIGDTESAIRAYEDFINTDPSEPVLERVYNNLGVFYDDLGNEARALEYFEKSNDIRYKQDITLLLISKYFDRGDFSNSMRNINLLLRNSPNNAAALYFRAMIKYQEGDLPGAREDFVRIQNDRTYGSSAKHYIESIDSEM